MSKKLTEKDAVTTMSDSDFIVGQFGGKVGRMSIPNFRTHLNDNDNQVLNDLAFYIDVNKASSLGSTRVDVGGNLNMFAMWEDAHEDALMDASGNYCLLNPSDCRYTTEGDAVVDTDTGAVLDKWAKCDFMRIIPLTYGHVQTVTVGTTTVQRLWLSLVPLPNGYIIPKQVVAKFKVSIVNNQLRSLPNQVPAGSKTINAFWTLAQARSKNHGLANLDFRNSLLFYMMVKYKYRDSQNCKGDDGTQVWGVGLDGTESTLQTGQSDKFAVQKSIVTGATLSLGKYDGKVAVSDLNGDTCHSVNVCGFENPWGQYWEMVQGLCSVGTDVYCWRSNFLPTGTPTATSFANVDHVLLTRPTTAVWGMNIIASEDGQGVYMIPKESVSGISYGDNFWYSASGLLWLFGGNSNYGSRCGLAYAYSAAGWSYSTSGVSARLAYYGTVNKVSATKLAELTA